MQVWDFLEQQLKWVQCEYGWEQGEEGHGGGGWFDGGVLLLLGKYLSNVLMFSLSSSTLILASKTDTCCSLSTTEASSWVILD